MPYGIKCLFKLSLEIPGWRMSEERFSKDYTMDGFNSQMSYMRIL